MTQTEGGPPSSHTQTLSNLFSLVQDLKLIISDQSKTPSQMPVWHVGLVVCVCLGDLIVIEAIIIKLCI